VTRIDIGAALRLLAAFAMLPVAMHAAAGAPLRTVAYGPLPAQVASLCLPEGGGPHAAALLIHGGGWSAGSRDAFAGLAQWFCDNGVVAMTIDYRLAPAPGADRPESRARWPAQREDARQAVWWLREHADSLHLDPHRVLALGGSAGGLLAGWLGTSDQVDAQGTHARVDAVVSLWGPWDLTDAPPRSDARHMIAGLVGDQPPREASPIFQVDGHAAPTLFVHGTADTLVPPDQSSRACEALRAASVPCEVVMLEGQGHGPAHVDMGRLLARIAAFSTSAFARPRP